MASAWQPLDELPQLPSPALRLYLCGELTMVLMVPFMLSYSIRSYSTWPVVTSSIDEAAELSVYAMQYLNGMLH